MSVYDIRSISQVGTVEPFELQVSRGQIPGHRSVSVFGYNPDVDTTRVTVWPYTGILPLIPVAAQLKVSSSDANDTAAGTGARTVFVAGLDANHREISEIVTLNGQTEVLTANSYLHINEAYVATAGSTLSAAGDIYFGAGLVTAGVPATVYDLIKFDYNRRITGSYTIPAGFTGYLSQGLFSAGQPGGSAQVVGRLLTIGTDNIRRAAAITTVNNGVADYVFEYPVAIPEKTTIEATAQGSSNNNEASSFFVLVLVKNGGPL
jgi:hypothetical protein